jgi:hypothetical protein
MRATTAVLMIACWVVGVGLLGVYLEVQTVRCGMHIRLLLRDEEARVERQRALELRYNRLVSPDRLERECPGDFETGATEPGGLVEERLELD